MKQKLDIILRPQKILFAKRYIEISGGCSGGYRIPYKKIVLACLRIYDKGTDTYYEPEIVNITSDMEGELFLYDTDHCRFKIKTDLAGKTAGAVLLELAIHAPYVLIGGQTWFDVENEMDFAEIGDMVHLMRWCQ